MPKTKRLYYGPWKLRRHEPVHQITIRPAQHGDPLITIESYKEWERMIGPGVPYSEAHKEEHDQVSLRHLMEKLKLKDIDHTFLELMRGGIEAIFKLAHTYQWYLRKEEEKRNRPEMKEKERRARERERESDRRWKKEQKDRERKERLKKLQEKKEKEARERAIRLEAKKKADAEKAQKKKFEDQLKKDAAAKKAKEQQEELQLRQYADSWLKPPGRRIEL